MISYEELVEYYIESTANTIGASTGQYRYLVFYNNQEEKKFIQKWTAEMEENNNLNFEMVQLDEFYKAENYHQKYQLRSRRAVYNKLKEIYINEENLISSHLAAKFNAFSSGLISEEAIIKILDDSYLSPIYPNKFAELKELIK